jgi:hypothetical protein
MKVSLNLKPVELPDGLSCLSEVIDHVEESQLKAGEVLTRILLNGEELDEEQELLQGAASVGSIEFLELHSARTLDLAREGLEDAAQLLPSLVEDMPQVAAELRGGNVRDGLEMFTACVEVISWYVSLVSAVDVIFRRADPNFRLDTVAGHTGEELAPEADLEALAVEDGPELKTFASIENLRQKLLDVEQAQSNNDTLLLADLVEYELMPIVQIWAGEAPVLLGKVNREGGAA